MHSHLRAAAGAAAVLAVLSVTAAPAAADRVGDEQRRLRSVEAIRAHGVSQGAGMLGAAPRVMILPAGSQSSPAQLCPPPPPRFSDDGDRTFNSLDELLWDDVGGWWSVAFLGVGLLVGGALVGVLGRLRRRRATG